MKKMLALSCALLSLAMLAPMMGCGGSDSSSSTSDSVTRNAVVVTESGSKAVRISWKNPFSPENAIIQYQIYRAVVSPSSPEFPIYPVTQPGDGFPAVLPALDSVLVGVTDGQTTTFTDTTEERSFERQNLETTSSLMPHLPTALSTGTTSASGLKSGDYVYSVRVIYRYTESPYGNLGIGSNPGPYYGDALIIDRTNKVRLD